MDLDLAPQSVSNFDETPLLNPLVRENEMTLTSYQFLLYLVRMMHRAILREALAQDMG
jgi:hypothetical protein